MLANLAMTAGRLDPAGVWDLEDESALAAAKTLIVQYSELEPRRDDSEKYLAAVPGVAPPENDPIA